MTGPELLQKILTDLDLAALLTMAGALGAGAKWLGDKILERSRQRLDLQTIINKSITDATDSLVKANQVLSIQMDALQKDLAESREEARKLREEVISLNRKLDYVIRVTGFDPSTLS